MIMDQIVYQAYSTDHCASSYKRFWTQNANDIDDDYFPDKIDITSFPAAW